MLLLLNSPGPFSHLEGSSFPDLGRPFRFQRLEGNCGPRTRLCWVPLVCVWGVSQLLETLDASLGSTLLPNLVVSQLHMKRQVAVTQICV